MHRQALRFSLKMYYRLPVHTSLFQVLNLSLRIFQRFLLCFGFSFEPEEYVCWQLQQAMESNLSFQPGPRPNNRPSLTFHKPNNLQA